MRILPKYHMQALSADTLWTRLLPNPLQIGASILGYMEGFESERRGEMKKSKPDIYKLMSPAQKGLLFLGGHTKELGLENDKRIRNALRTISLDPNNPDSVKQAVNTALAIMRASPQFSRAVFDRNPFPYTRGRAIGPIIFGRERDSIIGKVFPVGLYPDELQQNTLIAGRAGSGKTTTIFAVIEGLRRLGIPFWWIDFKQDGRHLLRVMDELLVLRPDNCRLNPLVPPRKGIEYKWIQIVTNIFFDAFFHTSAEASRAFFLGLLDNLFEKYGVFEGSDCYPSFFEIDYLLNEENDPNYKRRSPQDKDRMRTIRNRIRPMLRMLAYMFDCSRGFLCEELLTKSVIFEFDGLAPEYQKFLINLIFHWTFTYRIEGGMRNHHPLVLIFDEGKKVYAGASGVSILSELTSMAREFGLGLVVADQMPHVLGDAIKDNVFTTIALSQSSPKNVNEMAAMLGLNEDQKEYLRHLPVGKAVVKFNG